jgi:hypothetical protein
VLKKNWGFKKEVTKRCGIKLCNKNSDEFYSLPNIIKTIKWKAMRQVGEDAVMEGGGGRQKFTEFLVCKP